MTTTTGGGREPLVRFKGGSVLHGEEGTCRPSLAEGGDVWVRNGKVLDHMKLFYEERVSPSREFDCTGLIVAPGFIDIQINGAFGIDFSSLEEGKVAEGVAKVSRHLLEHGVTAYCPTVVTSSPDYYRRTLPLIRPTQGGREGAAVIGVHCEGPFISREKKGAHEEALVQSTVSPELIQECYGSQNLMDSIRIITLAPELTGALETIEWLDTYRTSSGEGEEKEEGKKIIISLGHSMAQFACAEKAVMSGATHITHLFNAMLPFHHRDPGIVGLLTSQNLNRKIFYGIIADGNHTHETVQRIAYKSNPEGVVLVTDAIAAAGLVEGVHQLGRLAVDVKYVNPKDPKRRRGSAQLAGTCTLAGSVATMDQCVRSFKEATGCSTAEALTAASLHPAQVLGLYRKGSLNHGCDADMVLLTSDLEVDATCIAGQVVWARPGGRISKQLLQSERISESVE